MAESPPFVVRDLRDDDWNFICKTWRKTYRHTEPHVPLHVFAASLSRRLERYRQHKDCNFLIACDPENTDYILGWGCVQDDYVHYACVRDMFRRHGVATGMLGKRDIYIATHWTKTCEDIAKEHPGKLRYEPSGR